MTEKEYEALHDALVAAHKILPAENYCSRKEAEFREKILKLEKAVLKSQRRRYARRVRQGTTSEINTRAIC
jgi:hypothetical protein